MYFDYCVSLLIFAVYVHLHLPYVIDLYAVYRYLYSSNVHVCVHVY